MKEEKCGGREDGSFSAYLSAHTAALSHPCPKSANHSSGLGSAAIAGGYSSELRHLK